MAKIKEKTWDIPEIDEERVCRVMSSFTAYVNAEERRLHGDCDGFLRFFASDADGCDEAGFLIKENFKVELFENAQGKLRTDEWTYSMIGTGEIGKRVREAFGLSENNLVDRMNMGRVADILKGNEAPVHEVEKTLYSIYKGDNPGRAFSDAKNIFHTYEVVSYLFFLKDFNCFLPLHPRSMGRIFSEFFGIEYKMAGRCEWDNYCGYIGIMRRIRDMMNERMPLKNEARLIDALSFVWMLHEYPDIRNYRIEDNEADGEGYEEEPREAPGPEEKRSVNREEYHRNPNVVREAKARAGGQCQLCGKIGPFLDKNGKPYLEVHHVIPLADGGADNAANAVALCPNCHRKIHALGRKQDVDALMEVLRRYE